MTHLKGLIVACFALMLVSTSLILSLLLFVRYPAKGTAAPILSSNVSMLSTTFSTQILPSNGMPVTLETIPLYLNTAGQVQVTAMLDLSVSSSKGKPAGKGKAAAMFTYSIILDGGSLITLQKSLYDLPFDQMVGLTAASPLSAGSHLLAVVCTGTLASAYGASGSGIQVSSGGMSALVASSIALPPSPSPSSPSPCVALARFSSTSMNATMLLRASDLIAKATATSNVSTATPTVTPITLTPTPAETPVTPTPTATATDTPTPAATVMSTPTPTVMPTPTLAPTPAPTPADPPTPTAIPTPSPTPCVT